MDFNIFFHISERKFVFNSLTVISIDVYLLLSLQTFNQIAKYENFLYKIVLEIFYDLGLKSYRN